MPLFGVGGKKLGPLQSHFVRIRDLWYVCPCSSVGGLPLFISGEDNSRLKCLVRSMLRVCNWQLSGDTSPVYNSEEWSF